MDHIHHIDCVNYDHMDHVYHAPDQIYYMIHVNHPMDHTDYLNHMKDDDDGGDDDEDDDGDGGGYDGDYMDHMDHFGVESYHEKQSWTFLSRGQSHLRFFYQHPDRPWSRILYLPTKTDSTLYPCILKCTHHHMYLYNCKYKYIQTLIRPKGVSASYVICNCFSEIWGVTAINAR